MNFRVSFAAHPSFLASLPSLPYLPSLHLPPSPTFLPLPPSLPPLPDLPYLTSLPSLPFLPFLSSFPLPPASAPLHSFCEELTIVRVEIKEDNGTSNITTADSDGLVLSMTTTVGLGFGSHIIVPGYGFVLNDSMDDFSVVGRANGTGYEPSPANYG